MEQTYAQQMRDTDVNDLITQYVKDVQNKPRRINT